MLNYHVFLTDYILLKFHGIKRRFFLNIKSGLILTFTYIHKYADYLFNLEMIIYVF